MKLCIDCKHIWVDKNILNSRCERTKTEKVNPVDGRVIVHMNLCDILRGGEMAGDCGVPAYFWEAKNDNL